MNLGLRYSPNRRVPVAYADADWGSDAIDRKSYSAHVIILSGSPILWEPKKQKTVALSSAEAEYMAMSECAKEVIYFRNLLKELGFEQLRSVNIYNDNQEALKFSENNVHHARTKHIDIKHHFLRDCVKNDEFTIKYLSTEEMIADMLTKPLARKKFEMCIE